MISHTIENRIQLRIEYFVFSHTNISKKSLRSIAKFEFVFRFHCILKLSKTYWQLEAVKTIVTKGEEITDHKQAA